MRVRALVSVVWAVLLVACGGGGGEAAPSEPAAPPASGATARTGATAAAGAAGGSVSGAVTVFAAASLTDAFEDLGARFEQANPDVDVAFNFGSSSTLATQIIEGAPVDVFASADQTQMDIVDDAELVVGGRADFAGNRLQIAVEPGNPKAIGSLEDLAQPDVTVVLAAEEVPAGEYTRQALDEQGLAAEPASLETDVRAVLSRVALGEADAGIVYVSDVVAADGEVAGVAIPADQNVPASYPIAALAEAPNPEGGAAFVAYVLSGEGQEVLDQFGFSSP